MNAKQNGEDKVINLSHSLYIVEEAQLQYIVWAVCVDFSDSTSGLVN